MSGTPLRVVHMDEHFLPTLTDAFHDLFLPALISANRAKDTIQSYKRYVKSWGDYWDSLADKDGTPCPVLTEISISHLDQYRRHLVEVQNFSPRNANKYVGGIESILARCETRGAIDAGGRYVVDKAPKLGRLSGERKKAPKLYFRFLQRQEASRLAELATAPSPSSSEQAELAALRQLDHLSRLYQACDRAEWPRRDRQGHPIDTRHHWRAAIVMYASYGFRTEELISYTADATPIPWQQISWDRETPATGYHATNEHGWFWYVPEKQAWTKSDPLVLPLSQVAAAHLKRIQPWPDDYSPCESDLARPVFNWPSSNYSFYSQWQAIVDAAGFPTKRDLTTGKVIKLLPKHLRKTCDTWHNYYRPGIAPLITGHADRDLSHQSNQIVADHYDNAEFAIVDAVNNLPVPEAWQASNGQPILKQQRLF